MNGSKLSKPELMAVMHKLQELDPESMENFNLVSKKAENAMQSSYLYNVSSKWEFLDTADPEKCQKDLELITKTGQNVSTLNNSQLNILEKDDRIKECFQRADMQCVKVHTLHHHKVIIHSYYTPLEDYGIELQYDQFCDNTSPTWIID